MKTLATADPSRATELLTQAPQLSYAIFQALLIMGLVSPDAINSVLEPGAPPIAAHQAAYGVATGTPPVAVGGGGYAPPPQAAAAVAPPAQTQAPPAGQDPDALMRAVMELPQETIDQLPEAERQQIMALRASYAAQVRR
jgi:cleavage stimulation factor subunit 2